MTVQRGRFSGPLRLIFLTLPFICIVLVLVVFLPPDGRERAHWAQFVGRFHPLAVHFPIALILLLPILELAGRSNRFSYLRLSASFVLGLASAAATLAAMLGWCLARNGGYSGPLLTQHMWGGISLAAMCWLCWLLRTRSNEAGPGLGLAYAIALAAAVGLVAWTGYRGGQLSLGEDHLTELMPPELRQVLELSSADASPPVDPDTFYGARVQPIFAARCVSCHGGSKHKANLRLDSVAAALRGGKDGPVVLPGNAAGSDLFRRITLPSGHDDFMPKGKLPLSPEQVKLIELWIGAGASATLAVDAIKDAPPTLAALAPTAEVAFPEIVPATVAQLRAGIAPAIAHLQKQFPGILEYESRSSANLELNASLLGPKFADTDLAAFAPLADHITLADFSRTAITDHSANAIAAMKQLRVLRLTNTGITDATLRGLGNLDQLESLNVFSTKVTPAALPTIEKLPKLQHFYAGQTAIPPGISIPTTLAGKIIF